MASESKKSISENQFFRTGDVGIKLVYGCIKIVDRLKDMIIVSGFNVYPNEIEEVLTNHPNVIEAAVIGETDDKTGERVFAYITVKDAESDVNIMSYCREHLTAYKVPKRVVFVKELPKSTVGKILRRELRAQVDN